MNIPKSITICEVGLRDGLQNEKTALQTADKIELAKMIIDSGIKVIELGSFVSPKAVPVMADTAEVFRAIGEIPGVELRAFTPNKRGMETALSCGCKKAKLNVSASRAHNIANLNKTPEESVAGFKEAVDFALENGITVSGSISMPFGSPWEHKIPLDDVRAIIDAYLAVGVTEISLSDASGMAVPGQVNAICAAVQKEYPNVSWWLHAHNTRGTAIGNILAAMDAGFTHFDASFAGLGGCPFVPNAAGNVATEDVVHMFYEMGVDTGIDLDKCIATARRAREMVGHDSDSYILKAGASKDLNLPLPQKKA